MIPMVDLKKNYSDIKSEVIKEITEVMEGAQFILGKRSHALEEQISEFLGVKNALSVASGTDALHIALRALQIGQGDEVITTPFTFFATAEAIAYVGATPVFVDIQEDTLNINPSLIEEKITERTKAILPVHIFGHPADMTEIMSLANRYNLKVVEDCAQSFGACIGDKRAGSFGDAGCFSFYPTKNLGGYGDGGMVVFNNDKIHELIKKLRNHGSLGGYIHDMIGYNSRLDEMQAAVLLVKMRRIDRYNEQRRNCACIYSQMLKEIPVSCPIEKRGALHVYHQYTIRSEHRDLIRERLHAEGIASVVYYPIPLHLQRAMSYLGYKKGDFPVAESLSRQVLSLPIYPELEKEDIYKICKVIIETINSL